DGHYALRSTADPDNRIREGDAETNNSGTIYFSVEDGALVGLPPPAACAVTPTSGVMLQTADVTCTGFLAQEAVYLSWDSPENGAIVQIDADQDGTGSGSLTVPESVGGGHKLVAQGRSSGREMGVIFAVDADIRLGLDLLRPGTPLPFDLTGFGAEEPLLLSWSNADSAFQPIGRAATNEQGFASALFTLPPEALGEVTISAQGIKSDMSAAAIAQISADAPATPVFSGDEELEPLARASPEASPVAAAPPLAPHANVIDVTTDETKVSFKIEVSNAETVVIEYGEESFGHTVRAEPSGNDRYQVTLADLDPETTYTYRVVAVGESGYAASDLATVTLEK
ncbi:MAG: fibronectin type III domain-containing protein, partial [Chloroflexota bacterium]|nr:fibronectin type III domain-containing protein [Chloroflexota bacterium]